MSRLGFLLLLLPTLACGPSHVRQTTTTPGSELSVFGLDSESRYIVDPNTHTCALVYIPGDFASTVAIPVDCSQLAANVPEAGKVITWTSSAPGPAQPSTSSSAP